MAYKYVAEATTTFDEEINSLLQTRDSLNSDFDAIVDQIIACKGKVILSGVGKSGIIAHKIASTFSSLGTPAFFLHPTEALHGDIGVVTEDDVVILISRSGTTEELVCLADKLMQVRCPIIVVTGDPKSELAMKCKNIIIIPVRTEAGYIKLAPTSSITAVLVLGDALAMTVAHAKKYKTEDFIQHHPGGSIGKTVL